MMSNFQGKEFNIIFHGTNRVKSSTIISTLVTFSQIFQTVNLEINPVSKLDIEIKPFAPGSFKLCAEVKSNSSEGVFKNEETDIVNSKEVVEITTEILKTREFIAENKDFERNSEEGKIKYVSKMGAIHYTSERADKIYKSNRFIDDVLSDTFTTLRIDKEITKVSLTDENETIYEVESKDFDILGNKTLAEEDARTREDIVTNESLVILKPAFEKGYKWDVYNHGNKISVAVEDEYLHELIDGGLRFGKGDKIIVDLMIHKEYDENLLIYINKSYSIIKFKEHQPKIDITQEGLGI